jgi:hypothetical protein
MRKFSTYLVIILLTGAPCLMYAFTQGQAANINQLKSDIEKGKLNAKQAHDRALVITKGIPPTARIVESLIEVAEKKFGIPNILEDILVQGAVTAPTITTIPPASHPAQTQESSDSLSKQLVTVPLLESSKKSVLNVDAFIKKIQEIKSIVTTTMHAAVQESTQHPSYWWATWSKRAEAYTDRFFNEIDHELSPIRLSIFTLPENEKFALKKIVVETLVILYIYRYLNYIAPGNEQSIRQLIQFTQEQIVPIIEAYITHAVPYAWMTKKIFAKITLKIMAVKIADLTERKSREEQKTKIKNNVAQIIALLFQDINDLVERNPRIPGPAYIGTYAFFSQEDFNNIKTIQDFLDANPEFTQGIILEPRALDYINDIRKRGFKRDYTPEQKKIMSSATIPQLQAQFKELEARPSAGFMTQAEIQTIIDTAQDIARDLRDLGQDVGKVEEFIQTMVELNQHLESVVQRRKEKTMKK